jgi:hypothetical protein
MWDFFTYLCLGKYYTRKNAQLVTNLQTSCYKSVHKLSTSCVHTACSQFVVTSLEQAVNNQWTLIQLVTSLMALSALLQDCANKVCYSHDIARMLQGCQHKIVTILLYQACNGRVRTTLSPGQTRKHCCGNICDSRCFIKCFPVCPPVETLLREPNLLPEWREAKIFPSEFRNIWCFPMFLTNVS